MKSKAATIRNENRPAKGIRLAVALCLVGGLTLPRAAEAQLDEVKEAKVKAAYVYQFIKYVGWPDAAFENANSPLVIGTIGDDPVNPYLRLICQKRNAGNRPLQYQTVKNVQQARQCHILFVSTNGNAETVKAVLPAMSSEPVLTVGEHPAFAKNGGVISFVIVGANVRLQLSNKSATRHGLKISSQLAKLAQIVD